LFAERVGWLAVWSLVAISAGAQTWSCGTGRGALGGEALTAARTYGANQAGWDLGLLPESVSKAGCASSRSMYFSVPVAEGNYEVTVVLGGESAAETTVKAEARRPMVVRVATGARQYRSEVFTVNVRRPEIAGGGVVKRKPREMGSLDWDDRLTLEFAGKPAVRSIRVRPAAAAVPTVYIAGDSTVTDQEHEPWAAWGEMLPAFFGPGVAVANEAESGETLRSFVGENRFAKIFSTLKRGDYLLLQFGHNDQKPGKGNVSPEEYAALLRKYIDRTRDVGATPVLVTPMNRRTFDESGHVTDTLAPYPDVVRQVAAGEKVALIDLNSMSKTLYEAVGEAKSRALFVYAPAGTYPDQPEALHDDTHFNTYGAWELARCVVLGIQQDGLPLVKMLRAPGQRFDPRHPDVPESVAIPPTPFVDVQKPYER
jgi:lysophospholipase L1-like esterase